jgi:hypothetical protein
LIPRWVNCQAGSCRGQDSWVGPTRAIPWTPSPANPRVGALETGEPSDWGRSLGRPLGPGLLGAESSGGLGCAQTGSPGQDPGDGCLGVGAQSGTSGRELATGSYSGWDPRDWARQAGPLGLDPYPAEFPTDRVLPGRALLGQRPFEDQIEARGLLPMLWPSWSRRLVRCGRPRNRQGRPTAASG